MQLQNHYPWYCQSPEMRSNLLIMCKLLWLLLAINGIWGYFSDPFIPFWRWLDVFRFYPGLFEGFLKVLFLSCGLGLLFNYRVREMSLILGLGLFFFLLSSKAVFRNHLFICACAFLLCGLTKKDQEPWLLYAQLSLIYFGAALNKIWQLDWWNGRFMHNWLLNARESVVYEGIHNLLPTHVADHLFSWGALGVEISIALMLLSRKRRISAIWIILVFHTTLYTITGFRFGHFFEDIVIYLLVFLVIPEEPLEISFRAGQSSLIAVLLGFMNWNRQFRLNPKQSEGVHWIKLSYANQSAYNARAIGKIIMYSPATYFVLLMADTLVRALFSITGEHIVTATWFWAGILFYTWLWFGPKTESPKPGLMQLPE